ncbi:MAG: 4-hydroxy-tetrahydrodipicolinate reductase, partial [Gammaproteobacteria bacterium]
MTVRVGVCGAAGRMGKTILEVCSETDNVEIGAAIEYSGSSMIGVDAGEQAGIGNIGVAITDDISKVTDQFDVLIDFTVATSFTDNLEKCHAAGKGMVIGTTGLDDAQKELINKAAEDVPIVFAP